MTLEELIEETKPDGMYREDGSKKIALYYTRQKYHVYFEANINGVAKLIKLDEKDVEIDDENERIILR